MLVFPPIFIGINIMYSKLPNHHLAKAMRSIFISLPNVIGSVLYISASSVRCIMKADVEGLIEDQCGNPVRPSFMVNAFLFIAWVLGYIVPPLLSGKKVLTWVDVMTVKMSKFEGTQMMLFGILSTLTLLLFANTDEDGDGMTPFLTGLNDAVALIFFSLLSLVFYEYLAKPLLCRSRSSNTQDNNNLELTSNPDSFNMLDTGAINVGSV